MEEKRIFDGESKTPETPEVTEECEACEETVSKKEKKNSKKDKCGELLARIAALEADVKEKDDRYLRMAAEYDNFRRRSREEREATYDAALADTVSELLPIIDNLERAAAIEAEGPLKEGVMMIMRTVEGALAKLGVTAVGAPGDIFDPNLHNAVLHDEDPDKADGEIVEVYQKGYVKGKSLFVEVQF